MAVNGEGGDAARPLLGPLCANLQTSSASANESLRDFLVYYPAARQDLTVLARELADIQVVARLLSRNGGGADEGDGTAATSSIPPLLFTAIKSLVRNALELVAEISEFLERPDRSGDDGGFRGQAWLEHVAERIAGTIRSIETARIAMNLGLDALLLATNFQPENHDNDLPPYHSAQIIEEIVGLRLRLTQDGDSDEARVHFQRPIVTEFADTLQQYIEQTSSSLRVPQINGGGGSRSDASSMHSELAQPTTPAYNAIDITTPAPVQINILHIIKRDICNCEIREVVFFNRKSVPTIALATLEAPTRFYDINAVPVASMSGQHGVDMRFARDGQTWAYLGEEESRELNPWTHDGVHFKKPIVYIGDHVKGRKTQQMRAQDIRPLAFSPDTRYLVVAGSRGRMALYDARPGATLGGASVIYCHNDMVTHAAFTPDCHALVSLSVDGTIRLSDPESGESLGKLDTDTWKRPLFLGITPDSDVIVSIWGDTVYHWSYTTGSLESYTLGSRRNREGWPIAISPDCRFLACRNDDGVDLSDLHTGRILYSIRFQNGFVTAAAFSLDGKYLALAKASLSAGLTVTKSTLDVWELIF